MYKIYDIRDGDSLNSIANIFDTDVDTLNDINGFDSNYKFENTNQMIVPLNSDDMFGIYKVKDGDTIYNIANELGINYKDLLGINGIKEDDYIYKDEQIIIPLENTKFIITESGDTLESVAQKLSTNMDNIIDSNDEIYIEKDQLIAVKKDDIN